MNIRFLISTLIIMFCLFSCSGESSDNNSLEHNSTSVTMNSDFNIIGFRLGMSYGEIESTKSLYKDNKSIFTMAQFVYDEEYRLESLMLPRISIDMAQNRVKDRSSYIDYDFNTDEYIATLDTTGGWSKLHKGYYKKGDICIFMSYDSVFLYPYVAPFGPVIKGFQLGMPEYEARKIRDNTDRDLRMEFFIDQFKKTRTIVAITANGDQLKSIFNIQYIDNSFLEEFMKAYKISGEKINFDEFQKRYNYVLHEQARYVRYFPPFKEEFNTYIDCGNFCVVFRAEPGPNVFQVGKDDAFITLVSRKAYRGSRDVSKKNIGNKANFQ